MYNDFTVEEEQLIAIYAGDNPSRRTVIDGIKGVLRFIGDVDMVDLARQTVEKVERMTEGEFRQAYMGAVMI